ncbi:sulfurtransferase TusA family protein [Longispora sp. K20-0274]
MCVTLLLELRRHLAAAPPGTLVRVIADDPAAPLDLPAWCHLTGHGYLGVLDHEAGIPVYGLRVAAGPAVTDLASPWRIAGR